MPADPRRSSSGRRTIRAVYRIRPGVGEEIVHRRAPLVMVDLSDAAIKISGSPPAYVDHNGWRQSAEDGTTSMW